MAETDKQSIPENLTNGKKILRVFDGFGDDVEDSFTRFFSDGAIDHDKKIAQLFESNGFEITTGEFNRNNPLEIGISSDDEVKSRDQYLEAAQKVGIDMPKTYSPIDVLQTSDIIVAKVPEADRGEMKYLLETTDQKVKFISWALLYQNISTLPPNKMSQKKS